MKNRMTLFLASLAVMTGATLILAAIDETKKTPLNNPSPEPAVVALATQEDTPARAAPTPPQPSDTRKEARPTRLSFGLDDVVKMSQSGIATDVILTYVDNSTVAYSPTAEDVVRLHELGVPPQVTAELIRHGGQLRARQAQAEKENQTALAQQTQATPNYSIPYSYAAPAPSPTYVNYNYNYPANGYSSYPAYSYAYPDYSYATYPSFYFAYSRPFSYGYYHPYRYSNFYRRPFHYGVNVGFNFGGFRHGSPRFHGRGRF